ncbi:heavy-metal-associated domain-containing protein [Candidatus Bathyarchaeota archaeon]|nr:heavy-metal-associated domain-containing protein [Candidatus Bathyarchaeota archaeon]
MNSSIEKDISKVVFTVREINCKTCALAIEKQVKKLDGVKAVKTAIMLNKVIVEYDPLKIDISTIKRVVNKTGYSSYLTTAES